MMFRIVFIAFLFVLAACSTTDTDFARTSEEGVLTVFKSPTCGCCKGWGSHMEGEGYDVEYVDEMGLDMLKNDLDIPHSVRSCHTTMVDDYFVEGHIPAQVVDRLLEERPDADGIAMAGMPSGSPGMPGMKKETFIIYLVKDGKILEEYERI